MANVKIKVSKTMYAAAKAYNLAGTGWNGVTNIYELINSIAGVNLVVDRQPVSDCSKNVIEKNFNTVNVNVGIDFWGLVVNDLSINFATDMNAQYLMTFFVGAAYLNMANFNLATELTNDANRGNVANLIINPLLDKNFFQAGVDGLPVGMFGDGIVGFAAARANATIYKAQFADVWKGVTFTFDAVDDTNKVIESNFSAIVDGDSGVLSLTHTAAAGAYTIGTWRLSNATLFTAAQKNWLLVDLNLANVSNVGPIVMGYKA